MPNELTVVTETALQKTDEAQRFLPVMSMEVAIERRQTIVVAVQKLMKAGLDYGVIPGTGNKPTLLQPGADKLNNLFGLVPTFETTNQDLDWTGERHGGEAFFYYEVKCKLFRGDYLMGEGAGSANSWEAKYRYRKAARACPECSEEAIIKGKQEYGAGWLCYAKKGGCGAKFEDGDPAIEDQFTGDVPNPNAAEQVNTILKMANKRAKIAATLNAVSASEFFTQDREEMIPPAEMARESKPAAKARSNQNRANTPVQPASPIDQMKARMKDSDSCFREFQRMKSELTELLGDEGVEVYDNIIDSNPEIKNTGDAWKVATIMQQRIFALQSQTPNHEAIADLAQKL